MVVKLYGSVESLFILAGYEDGSTVLWDGNKNQMIWHKKEHKEPGNKISRNYLYEFL